jgi:hypothetical protein
MKLTNRTTTEAISALRDCFAEVEPVDPWRWQCASGDETHLPISVIFADGFLRLATEPDGLPCDAPAIDQALQFNRRLAGGVKFIIDPRRTRLRPCADVVVLDGSQLRARLSWVLHGLLGALEVIDFAADHVACQMEATKVEPPPGLPEILSRAAWEFTESAANEWSVALDADFSSPAKLRTGGDSISVSVELVRTTSAAALQRRALAMFLVTACSGIRFVRACAFERESETAFALEASLPLIPAVEELNHAMAALSVAHRLCAREAGVLLDEAAASCYLALRDSCQKHQPFNGKEN